MIQKFPGEYYYFNLHLTLKIYKLLKENDINIPLINKKNDNELELLDLMKYPLEIKVANYKSTDFTDYTKFKKERKFGFPAIEYRLKNTPQLINSRLDGVELMDKISINEVKFIDAKIKEINLILTDFCNRYDMILLEFTGYFGKEKNGKINYICDMSLGNINVFFNNLIINAETTNADIYKNILSKLP